MAPTTQTRRRDSETAKDRSLRGIQRECRDGGRHGGRMPERRDRAYEDEAPYVFMDTVKEVVLDVKSAASRRRNRPARVRGDAGCRTRSSRLTGT